MAEVEVVAREVPLDLRPHVRALWYLDGPPQRRFEKILPQPWAHLIVNLSAPYRQVARGAAPTGVTLDGPFLAGIQTQYLVNENPRHLRMLVAQFTAEGIGLFAQTGRGGLVDLVLPSADLVPGSASLVGLAREGAPVDALLDAVVAVLRAARRGPDPDGRVTRARSALEELRTVSITEAAAGVELSPRALTGRFARACGLTPKRFADVARFEALLSSLAHRDPLPTWGDLTAETSYYDQPHVSHAFTRFTGSPPARFLRDLREFGLDHATFVPLDSAPER